MIIQDKKAVVFHVFSHNLDEWYDELEEAKKAYSVLVSEYGTARLYEEVLDEEGDVEEENCLASQGGWPI